MLITRWANSERKIGICFINAKPSIQTEGLRTHGLLTGTWQVSEAWKLGTVSRLPLT